MFLSESAMFFCLGQYIPSLYTVSHALLNYALFAWLTVLISDPFTDPILPFKLCDNIMTIIVMTGLGQSVLWQDISEYDVPSITIIYVLCIILNHSKLNWKKLKLMIYKMIVLLIGRVKQVSLTYCSWAFCDITETFILSFTFCFA